MDRCEEVVLAGEPGYDVRLGGDTGMHQCKNPGHRVSMEAPAGRGAVSACYCDAHGGATRARHTVLVDWSIQAPAGVEDVDAAGAAGLTSRDAYVVVRSVPGGYIAALGVGSDTLNLPGRYSSREEAEAAAREAWRRQVEEDLARIRTMRGGTLEWGLPIQPRESPIVLYCEPGVSAWDALIALRSQPA